MVKKVNLGPKRSAVKAARLAEDLKALDILVMDIRKVSNMTDYFVICSGDSDTHVRAIANKIVTGLKEIDIKVFHREGEDTGLWVLLDYGDFIVHVFENQSRQYYELERLWGDAEIVFGSLPASGE